MGTFAAEVSRELAERGHRVLLLAPSRKPALVRESRKLIRAAREQSGRAVRPRRRGARARRRRAAVRRRPQGDRARAADRHRAHDRGGAVRRAAGLRARARAVGAERGQRRPAAQPRAQRRLLPRARRARPEHPGRAQVRRAVLRPHGRADRELRGHRRPAEALLPGLLRAAAARRDRRDADRRSPTARRCGSRSPTARSAARCGSSCAPCALLPEDLPWEAVVYSKTGAVPTLRSSLRHRVQIVDDEDLAFDGADIVVAASLGQVTAPGVLVRALGAGAVPLAARVPVYEEVLRDGDLGAFFQVGDVEVLASQLERLIREDDLRTTPGRARRRRARGARVEQGRRPGRGDLRAPGRAAPRPRPEARGPSAGRAQQADRGRSAHAHRPLQRLRDAGRRAARHRPRRRPRRDRGHRPQRDLRRPRRRAPRPPSTASR